MSHVSWTPRGALPSSGEGYPSSGKSPRNCAALSDRWTGGGSWLPAAAAAAAAEEGDETEDKPVSLDKKPLLFNLQNKS